MTTKRKIVYSEPADYFPKELREKYFGEGKKTTKKTVKKTTKKKSK